MGIEKDEPPKDKKHLVYTGKALGLKFPDIQVKDQNGNIFNQKVEFLTFKEWIHDVFLDNQVYKVIGEDLQVGMPIMINGQLFPIMEISEQYYHGRVSKSDHPFGKPGDTSKIPRYTFKRLIKGEDDYWLIQKKEEPTMYEYNYSEKDLSKLELNQLIQLYLACQSDIKKKIKEIKKANEDIQVLKEKLET